MCTLPCANPTGARHAPLGATRYKVWIQSLNSERDPEPLPNLEQLSPPRARCSCSDAPTAPMTALHGRAPARAPAHDRLLLRVGQSPARPRGMGPHTTELACSPVGDTTELACSPVGDTTELACSPVGVAPALLDAPARALDRGRSPRALLLTACSRSYAPPPRITSKAVTRTDERPSGSRFSYS